MTLAAVALIGFSWTVFLPPLMAQAAYQSPSQSTPPTSTSAQTQDQEAAPPQQAPPAETQPSAPAAAAQQPSAAQKSSAAKKPHHKKAVVASDCAAAPSSAGAASDPSVTPKGDAASAGNTSQPSTAPPAPTNCPPPKIIVRHGGTAEPSIQLAGGPDGDDASKKRNAVNQMLGITDANLKKIAARQLSSAQQDTVAQIRQFMQQSRAALGSGDLERARTLVWKAELLSEDLLKLQH